MWIFRNGRTRTRARARAHTGWNGAWKIPSGVTIDASGNRNISIDVRIQVNGHLAAQNIMSGTRKNYTMIDQACFPGHLSSGRDAFLSVHVYMCVYYFMNVDRIVCVPLRLFNQTKHQLNDWSTQYRVRNKGWQRVKRANEMRENCGRKRGANIALVVAVFCLFVGCKVAGIGYLEKMLISKLEETE